MLADKMSRQAAPSRRQESDVDRNGYQFKSDLNDEEGWVLLPDGRVLTVDCYTDSSSELVPAYPTNRPTPKSTTPIPVSGRAPAHDHTLTDPVTSEFGPLRTAAPTAVSPRVAARATLRSTTALRQVVGRSAPTAEPAGIPIHRAGRTRALLPTERAVCGERRSGTPGWRLLRSTARVLRIRRSQTDRRAPLRMAPTNRRGA